MSRRPRPGPRRPSPRIDSLDRRSISALGLALSDDLAVALQPFGGLLAQVGGWLREHDGAVLAARQGDGRLAGAGDNVALVGAAHLDVDDAAAVVDPLVDDLAGDDVAVAHV